MSSVFFSYFLSLSLSLTLSQYLFVLPSFYWWLLGVLEHRVVAAVVVVVVVVVVVAVGAKGSTTFVNVSAWCVFFCFRFLPSLLTLKR